MALSLSKGDITALDAKLIELTVALGRDERADDGVDFDLDASSFLPASLRRVRSDVDFIYYNQSSSTRSSVVCRGDKAAGNGEGDAETINVNFALTPSDVERIVFTASFFDAACNNQNFGMASGAYIRLVNAKKDEEIARSDLTDTTSEDRFVLSGELFAATASGVLKRTGLDSAMNSTRLLEIMASTFDAPLSIERGSR